MKVNKVNFYKNRFLKKGLEFAANNGALFAATTTLALSLGIRPISILATPKTDKENKQIACAKSIVSSLIGYAIMLGFSKPVSNAIKAIDNNPEKYLNKKTIKNLQGNSKQLTNAKAYTFATQLFKLGLGALIAVPKAMLIAFLLPLFIPTQKSNLTKSDKPNFTGLPNSIGKILNKNWLQRFAQKYKDTNFPMHIVAGTDAISTGVFIAQTKQNNRIKEERKKPLIYNAAISTGLSIASGYVVDKLLDKPTEKFINKFKLANKNSPKLDKYVEGIKIAKPILILGGIYYIIIPIISTFISDKLGKNKNDK